MTTISSTMFTSNCMLLFTNVDYVQFVDDFNSNLSYENAYSPHFQPFPNTQLWYAYTGLNIYGCLTR